MSALNILILGGSKGIGFAIAQHLSKTGMYKLTIVARSRPSEDLPNSTFVQADLSTIKGCKELVNSSLKGQQFDTFLGCVGIFARSTLTLTSEGIEEDLAVSYLSRFVTLTEMIKKDMFTGRKLVFIWGYPGQAITPLNVEDLGFEKNPGLYKQFPVHFNTVVCNEALTYELAKRYPNLHVFCMNPGVIQTGIRDNVHGGKSSWLGWILESLIGFTTISPEKYVSRYVVPLLESTELPNKTCIMFNQKGTEIQSKGWVAVEANREKIWKVSEEIVLKRA